MSLIISNYIIIFTAIKLNASFNALMKKSLSKCSTMLRFSVITDIVRQTSYTGGIKYYQMNYFSTFIRFY